MEPASAAGSSVFHGIPPCPHYRPFVSCLLGIPAVPVSVLRSSIQRGEWVLAGAVCPGREHSPPPASASGFLVFHGTLPCPHCRPLVSCVLGIPAVPISVLRSSIQRGLPFCLLCPWSTSCPCFSAEEFFPERRRWAGANARIPPTT